MGHLINPVGFHVGYFSNWSDIWSSPNGLIYAELVHNNLDFRRVMGLYFENFITDQYGIMYSHFTVERVGLSGATLKMYFYDGVVSQKLAFLIQQMYKLRRRKLRSHRRLLRRFRRTKLTSSVRVNFLRMWRYYDYSLARRIVFFLIYFMNLGHPAMSTSSFERLTARFYKIFDSTWASLLRKTPDLSVYSFIKCFVKILVVRGFDRASQSSRRLHSLPFLSSFSSFFQLLDKTLFFWSRRQSFFNFAVAKRKVDFYRFYKRFLSPLNAVDRFTLQFFTVLYYTYLLNFRQAKFFRFMSFLVNPVIKNIGLLNTRVEYFGLDNTAVSAVFLARYMARKLEMRFKLKELFTPVGRELKFLIKNTSFLLGYKLQFVGRLTRRGRVRTTWALGGRLPSSVMSAQIEHSFYLGILRNGICCVRVWFYRHKSFGNYNYNFLYKVKPSL